jgi:hypothetical protein
MGQLQYGGVCTSQRATVQGSYAEMVMDGVMARFCSLEPVSAFPNPDKETLQDGISLKAKIREISWDQSNHMSPLKQRTSLAGSEEM